MSLNNRILEKTERYLELVALLIQLYQQTIFLLNRLILRQCLRQLSAFPVSVRSLFKLRRPINNRNSKSVNNIYLFTVRKLAARLSSALF
jgi:hypothetical protein